jgi:hypothetical protein
MKRIDLGPRCAAVGMIVALGTFLSGCATPPPTRAYTGSERPESQVAKVSVDQTTRPPAFSGRTGEGATIRTLDGKEIRGGGRSAHPKDILILPGKHEVLAQVDGQGPGAAGALFGTMLAAAMENAVEKWNTPLIFNAEAGKTYLIRFEYVKGPESPAKEDFFDRNKGKLWVYWIEEAQTKKHVCGWRVDDIK